MFIYFTFALNLPIKIRLSGTERYLRGSSGDSLIAHLSDYEKADDYAYLWDDSEHEYLWLHVNNHFEKNLGYDMNQDALVLTHSEEDENQKFRLMPLDPFSEEYWIINNRKCLSWQESTSKFVLSECYENENLQKFNIVLQNFDFSALNLLANKEEKEMHGSINDKTFIKPQPIREGDEENISEAHMEQDAANMIKNVYKFLYDLSLCFVEKGTCKKGGFVAKKNLSQSSAYKKFESSRSVRASFQKQSYSSKTSIAASASAMSRSSAVARAAAVSYRT